MIGLPMLNVEKLWESITPLSVQYKLYKQRGRIRMNIIEDEVSRDHFFSLHCVKVI